MVVRKRCLHACLTLSLCEYMPSVCVLRGAFLRLYLHRSVKEDPMCTHNNMGGLARVCACVYTMFVCVFRAMFVCLYARAWESVFAMEVHDLVQIVTGY